jgi:hypothetical protein
MEVSLSGDKDRRWYQEKYGSYEKILVLIEAALDDLQRAAVALMRRPGFLPGHTSGRGAEELRLEDVQALVDAIRRGGIV